MRNLETTIVCQSLELNDDNDNYDDNFNDCDDDTLQPWRDERVEPEGDHRVGEGVSPQPQPRLHRPGPGPQNRPAVSGRRWVALIL